MKSFSSFFFVFVYEKEREREREEKGRESVEKQRRGVRVG